MGFNIMDLMNGATRAAVEGVDNYEAITLNLDEIKGTKHNRYSMDDLEELATSILMDGLQEPLIIGRVNGESSDRDMVVSFILRVRIIIISHI